MNCDRSQERVSIVLVLSSIPLIGENSRNGNLCTLVRREIVEKAPRSYGGSLT